MAGVADAAPAGGLVIDGVDDDIACGVLSAEWMDRTLLWRNLGYRAA